MLKSLVHKLAGSAGLYGFDELGEAAHRLDALLAEPPVSGAQWLLKLRAEMERLRQRFLQSAE